MKLADIVQEGWGADREKDRQTSRMVDVATILQQVKDDPRMSKIANYMAMNGWDADGIRGVIQQKRFYHPIEWWEKKIAKYEAEKGQVPDYTNQFADRYLRQN